MGKEKKKESSTSFLDDNKRFRWAILCAVAILSSIILFPNLVITRYRYNLGDVAQRDIKAPRDFFIEDQEATEANRRQSVDMVLTVYDYDSQLARVLNRNVEAVFTEMRAAANVQVSPEFQKHASTGGSAEVTDTADQTPAPIIAEQRRYLEEKLGIRVSQGAYEALEKIGFSKDISDLISRILQEILSNGVVTNKEILLKESEKGIILRDVRTKKERELHQLKKFYGLDQAKTMVRIVGQPMLRDLDYDLLNLVVDFVQRLIQPNITLNRSETQERKNKAAAEIKPVLHKIKAGEMLLREGELVTEVQLLKLQALETRTKKEQVFLTSVGAAMLLMCLLITTYILHFNQTGRLPAGHNKSLLFMASVFLTFFFLAELSSKFSEVLTQNSAIPIQMSSMRFGIPLAAGGHDNLCIYGIEYRLTPGGDYGFRLCSYI